MLNFCIVKSVRCRGIPIAPYGLKNNTKVGATTTFLALYQKSKNILVPSAPLEHNKNTLHESVHSLLKVTHSSIEVVFDKT